MGTLNEAVKTIIEHKANLIRNSQEYKKYIKNVLKKHGIVASADSEEKVKVLIEVFIMGAVDAMIYDVGTALDFTKQKRSVNDWTSYRKREDMLDGIF